MRERLISCMVERGEGVTSWEGVREQPHGNMGRGEGVTSWEGVREQPHGKG